MKPFVLNRRTFLRGTGALLALPTLEAMLNSHGTAYADGSELPCRFATFFWGNGVILPEWVPETTGDNWSPSRALAPLESVRSYVNVVTGYNIKARGNRDHHRGAAGILSGYPFIPIDPGNANYASKFGGPSIDQVAANIIGKETAIPSLQVAVSRRIVTGEGPTLRYISHKGPDEHLPPEFSPAALYNRLFGNRPPPSNGEPDPRAQLRSSVLDAVAEDSRRLSARLGQNDRARLDAHMTNLSELRRSILTIPDQECTHPALVTEENRASGGREPTKAVTRAMADLITAAWACDITRVASFMFSGSVGDNVFHEDLEQTRGNHDLTHDGSRNGQQQVADSVVWVMEQFAYWLERLQATPVAGGGNLLDQSCILATSDVAEGLPHSNTDYPVVVAGRGGGYLRYPGIHHRSSNGDNTSDILLTCLRAAGTGVTSVGGDSGYSDSECTPIKS